MKKNFWILFAILSTFGLSGCGGTFDRIVCAWDAFPSITGMASCAIFDRSFSEVFIEKYVPTAWYWLALAIIAMWLPLRSMKNWKSTAYIGLGMLMLSGTCFLYHWLNGWAFVIGLGLMVTGSTAIAALVAMAMTAANKVLLPLKLIGKGVMLAKSQVDKAAEEATHTKGVEAEKHHSVQTTPLLMFAILGTVITMAVLFGGPVFPEPPKNPSWNHWVNLILRVAGCLMATVSFGSIVYDLLHCYWLCDQCEATVWDHGQNKEFCPHCHYPNPRVHWICGKKDCGHENHGSDLYCQAPSCKEFHKGLTKHWIDATKQGKKCEKCGKIVGNAEPFCACGYPNPQIKWTCGKIQDGEACGRENPGTTIVCESCGKPRKGIPQKFLRSAPAPHTALPAQAPMRLLPANIPESLTACRQCNAGLRPEGKFCDKCGTPVEDTSEAAPSAPEEGGGNVLI